MKITSISHNYVVAVRVEKEMMEASYKAVKGLIRIKLKVEMETLREIEIAGDFFMYPEEKLWDLERSLEGTKTSRAAILSKVKTFYEQTGIITPGVAPEDFTEAIVRAVGDPSLL